MTYADTMVKAIGIEGAGLFSLGSKTVMLEGATRVVGAAGVAVGAVSIGISYYDKGYLSWNDKENLAAVALGIISVATPIGWIALSAGVASAAIAFYASATAPHSIPIVGLEAININ